jgi:hypothetical protein
VSRATQSPSRNRLKKAVPALGAAAGLSLSLASGASASQHRIICQRQVLERVTKFWRLHPCCRLRLPLPRQDRSRTDRCLGTPSVSQRRAKISVTIAARLMPNAVPIGALETV